MSKRLYVGNLSRDTTKNDLNQCFGQIGRVVEVAILRDSGSGESRGFGFVEMTDSEAAAAARIALDGSQLNGQTIKVQEAKPRTPPRLRYPATW